MTLSIEFCAITSLLLFVAGLHVAKAAHWGYWGDEGPNNWPGVCRTGTKQSPINIVRDHVVKTDLGALEFVRYNQLYSGSVTNNGHTVQIEFPGSSLEIKGSDLESIYVFEQMHAHWPSEHTVDEVHHSLELHLVHYNKKYGNVSHAAQYKNGIAVLAVLFELSPKNNEDLEPIVEATKHVSAWVGRSTTPMREQVNVYRLLPQDQKNYFRYDGSLTTPNCHESVMWFVFPQTVPVSKNQISVFENIETSTGKLAYNNRPVQDLGNRIVYHSLIGYSSAKSNFDTGLEIVLSRALCALLLSTFYSFINPL